MAFSTVYFIMCTHDSFSDCLFMGAHNKKTSLKCQPSGKSTDYWQTNGRIPETYGGKLTGNQCHSPTRGDNWRVCSSVASSMDARQPEISVTENDADVEITLSGRLPEGWKVCLAKGLPVELKLDEGEWWKQDYIYATVTNNTEETVYDILTVFATLDAEGNILCIDSDSQFAAYGLAPGSSVVVRREINKAFINFFTAKEITPATVDAIAYVNK